MSSGQMRRVMLLAAVAAAWCQGAVSGSGMLALPTAAAYADLTNAASEILETNAGSLAGKTIVIYDAGVFGVVPYYPGAVQQMKDALASLCGSAGAASARIVPSLDVGTAAAGLAGLIGALTPSYAIQGQQLAFDSTAWIAAFEAAANRHGEATINVAYLTAPATLKLGCGDYQSSVSLGDLWVAANEQADKVAGEAAHAPEERQKALEAKLAAFQKLKDSYLGMERGAALLGRLLVAQSLLAPLLADPSRYVAIDLRLDGVAMDSTTRSLLFWRKTTFSCNVVGHYTLLGVEANRGSISLKTIRTDTVNILTQGINADRFRNSTEPKGRINGASKP